MEFFELLVKLKGNTYVSVMQADFMKMPFDDNTFDAVYAIEATCHAPDPVRFFTKVYHQLCFLL
jgi:ubiquinone/menaquinone biosynthesis C-methylase UbiE